MCFEPDLSAVIIHPLHEDLPSMVCYLTPTCNRFTAEDCKERYKTIKALYEGCDLQHILGPLVGGSSDGDARRRVDQVERPSCVFLRLSYVWCDLCVYYHQVHLCRIWLKIDTDLSMTSRLRIPHFMTRTTTIQPRGFRAICPTKIGCSTRFFSACCFVAAQLR